KSEKLPLQSSRTDSQSESHAMERRKTPRGSPRCSDTGGRAATPYRSGARRPAGVDGTWRTDNRGSPGTWEILSSPPRAPGRETGSTTPGLGGALVRRGAKRTSGRERYRQTKATKCGGTGGRRAERLDSTDEAGELAPEDRVEGSEASVGRPDRGKHAEHIEVLPHVHWTRTDSHGDPCMIDSGQSAILAPVS